MKKKISLGISLGLIFSFCLSAHSETLTVSRRLVRFDGQPAAGARVRVMSDYGDTNQNTDFEVVADTNGIFSAEVTQTDSLWVGHIIINAEGCATLCETSVTGRRKGEPLVPVRRLGAPFHIGGITSDAAGRPIAGAKISLVCARPQNWNEIPFNSTMTHLTTTPEMIAQSDTNGTWSMTGVDFAWQGLSQPATVTFEGVADNPRRVSRVELKLDPDPGTAARKNITLDFKLAPPVRVTGRVVDFVTGKPVAGAQCLRAEIFTGLAGTSALTGQSGQFELEIPGPLPLLWFWVYRDGFDETTLSTARREPPTSDWAGTNDLLVTLRPMVTVAGTLRDENGKPPDEPMELFANYHFDDQVNAKWDQVCQGSGSGSKIGADGSFTAKLPVGQVTFVLFRPRSNFPASGAELPKHYRLQQQFDIPASGITNLTLRVSTIDGTK